LNNRLQVTTSVETFAEVGIQFRKDSPFPHSFMIELVNGYYGYMPTARHFPLGGYETWLGTNNLEPTAAEQMLTALKEMCAELMRP
jgi:neutral ceramidase